MNTNRPKTLPSELLRNSQVARKLLQCEARRRESAVKCEVIDSNYSYSVLKVLTFKYLKEDPTERWDFFLYFD